MADNYKYIEIIRYEDRSVVKRVDVSSKTERQIDVIWRGMNRNLNHEEYCTKEVVSDTELITPNQ